MASPVDWRFAERVALRFSGSEPFAASYHAESLVPDFAELTTEAEELVAEATGLRSLAGPARAQVVDRAAWIRANLASFQRLLRAAAREGRRPHRHAACPPPSRRR